MSDRYGDRRQQILLLFDWRERQRLRAAMLPRDGAGLLVDRAGYDAQEALADVRLQGA